MKEGCEIGFLRYLLQGLHLESYKTDAAIPHIYFKDYGKTKVPFPPLSEQQHIVEELDLLSSIIEKKKAQLKEVDHLAQSIFYEMFGDPITNELTDVKTAGLVGSITSVILCFTICFIVYVWEMRRINKSIKEIDELEQM
ncbi:MAG: restriction endonuclease subunit S [Prevotella sp.]|nr:restriction endonuclease subunit S [Prevotella sp.]